MKLGDRLPPDQKRQYIRGSLVPGRILHLHCSFTNPPKQKFVVVVSMNPEPLLFLINSEISQWLEKRQDLRDCQVVIHHADHTYLRYDSYLDCTQAKPQQVEEIERQLMENLDGVKDFITSGEREATLYAVQACRTLSAREKRRITEGLSG